jgi:hypothetical protein
MVVIQQSSSYLKKHDPACKDNDSLQVAHDVIGKAAGGSNDLEQQVHSKKVYKGGGKWQPCMPG